MKIIIFIISLFVIPILSVSQTCPLRIDIQNETKVCGVYGDANGNSNWNWELNNPNNPAYCSNWYARTNNNLYLTRMGSPFVNATSGRIKIIADAGDYTKAKGWELLQRKFGCWVDAPNPYFVLYNKFTGVMRVYVYVSAGSGVYSQIMMRVRGVNPKRPATLSQASDVMDTPKDYLDGSTTLSYTEESLISITDAVGNGSWTMGEFHTTLDHNIAESLYSTASIEVSVYGVTNSTIKAKLVGTSATGPNAEDLKDGMFIKKNAPTNSQQFSFTVYGEKLIKFGKKVDDLIGSINSTAIKVAQAVSPPPSFGLKRKIYDGATFAAFVSSDNFKFKKEINKFTKYIGAAGEVLKLAGKITGFFENTPGTATPAPSFTNYNLDLEGAITSQAVVSSFVVKLPATTEPATNGNNATYYNCNLGTFNLKKKPVVEFLSYDRRALMPGNISPNKKVPKTVRYTAYRVSEDVQMVINAGAGLELVSAEGALMALSRKKISVLNENPNIIQLNPLERHPDRGNYTYFNHMYADVLANRLVISNYDVSGEQLHMVQTPFYDMKCIKNASMNITDSTLIPFFRVRATMRKIGDPSGELLYYINDYNIEKVPGVISDIPADVSYDLSAFPPYRNYTIPPNVESISRPGQGSTTFWRDATADDYIVDQLPSINQANARYNHSIITNPNYYTTISNPTNGVVTFRAGAYIELNPKFETQLGARFLATIDFGYFNLECSPNQDLTLYNNPTSSCYNVGIEAQRTQQVIVETKEDDLIIYPNPAKEYAVLKFKAFTNVKNVLIINELGIAINGKFSITKNNITLNSLSSFRNGMYFVKVICNDKVITRKLKINN